MTSGQIKAIEENAIAYYECIARFLGGQFHEQEDFVWFTTQCRSVFRFNGVVHTAVRSDELSRVVDPMLESFLSQNLPFFWVAWPDVGTPGLGDYLSSKPISFIRIEKMPVMICALNDLPQASLPNGVEICPVQSQQDQADWLNIFMEGFDEPELARPDVELILAGSLNQTESTYEYFLARWEGKPCSISTLFCTEHAAGIYSVTTLPEYRGRGLGTALTVTAMKSARAAGYSEAMLFATPSGYLVYKRLGFETVSTADLFIWNGNG
jgi:GNAT superfamily N-acetyltransferase